VHFLQFELGGFELVVGLAKASRYPKKEDNLSATVRSAKGVILIIMVTF
jgi:hypothetical protein